MTARGRKGRTPQSRAKAALTLKARWSALSQEEKNAHVQKSAEGYYDKHPEKRP